MIHSDWIKWRKDGIGGSDSAVILKLFPFGKTPLMLYREKISQDEGFSGNLATKHGQDNENRALDWFEKKMGCTLFRQVRVQNSKIPWIRATLDGIDGFDKYMVEAKCPFNLENHNAVKDTKKVPEIYYPQCQHQILAKEVDGMYFESFNSKDPEDSIIIEVARDDKFIEEMLPEYEKFWNCVKNRTPPEATEYDFFCMEEDERWKEASEKYKEAKEWSEKAEHWRQELISLAEGRSCQGSGLRLTKSECEGFIDYSKIPELFGIDKEPYRKPKFTKWTATIL